jgi:acetyl-CoA carboxylase, biotin carboxylase subunit
MSAALDRFDIAGLPTTIPFHRDVMQHEDFRRGQVTTRWVEERFLAA